MNNSFNLPVEYKGDELLFPASLIKHTYSYKIEMDIFGQSVFFEPDEEMNFRAITNSGNDLQQTIDTVLLQLIAENLHELFK
jgi:hypothetical protein